MSRKPTLNQEYIRSIFNYDLSTGIFSWRYKFSRSVNAGAPAGWLDRHGYTNIGLHGKRYLSHRLAFLYVLGWIPAEVDHINHDRNDNRWINLAASTHHKNHKNISLKSTNTSGYNGVHFDRKYGTWRAQICVGNKQIKLGRFRFKEDAIKARKLANEKHGFHVNHGSSEKQ